jgi:transglutaminase-like putative cysteine protease
MLNVSPSLMKTPPLLLFAALLFWGWESKLLFYGALAGAVLEAARVVKLRWELEDVDFNRIWSFCVLVMVGLAAYIFTTNDQGAGVSGMFHGVAGLRSASASSTVATTSVLRWLPLILLPFIAAQIYNVRPTVPLTAVSLVLRIRRRRGEVSLAGRYLDVSYAYFIICVFSAGIHSNLGSYSYFWGQVILILWALWTMRTRRFGLKVWAGGLAVVIVLGFLGQVGINRFERLVQNLDARLFARFFHAAADPTQSITSIGEIGELELSSRIVIRLQPGELGEAPNYLREASYRIYNPRNHSWLSGGSINDFSPVGPEADNLTWLLLPAKKCASTVNIACYLEGRSKDEGLPEGLLPLPSGVGRLEKLPATATSVQTNQTGAVLATGLGLMIFDARYGPGATIDSPPDLGTNQMDLAVPTNDLPALQQVLAGLDLTNASDLQKRLAVQEFFARNFTYSSWQGPEKYASTGTPLTRFLLNSRSGHCEYFATATVLLLRELGIPARYAVGYAVHETSGSGYVVRERDAHAWALVWNRQARAWEDLDTTPGSWVAIEGRNGSWLDHLSDLRSWLVFQYEKLRWRQANLRQYIFWTISPVMAVLVYYIIFQRRSKTRPEGKRVAAEPDLNWPGHDSAFYRLEESLAARGLPRQPQELLSDWLERALAEPALAELRRPLRELLQLHYRYRFDPLGLNDAEKTSLMENADTILATLARMKPANG